MIARLRLALDVLLHGFTEETHEILPPGPAYRAPCAIDPESDFAEVRSVSARDDGRRLVMVAVAQATAGSVAVIGLTPAWARALAAGLLNRADEIEGLTPLTFLPDNSGEAS